MNVVFISECHKNALEETRFILDQYAMRCGCRTWISSLSLQGLETVHSLLKRHARKNSCIICYSFFGNSYKVQFVVGTKAKISEYNAIPTNTSSSSFLRHCDSNFALYQAIALLARIAGLFHDYGKSSQSFQKKLSCNKNTDAIRHEFISALYVYSIAKDKSDLEFLDVLEHMCKSSDCQISKLNINTSIKIKSLKSRIAQSLVFLILSHHFLPFSESKDLKNVDNFFTENGFGIRYKLCYTLKNKNAKVEDEIDLSKNNLFKSSSFCSKLRDCIIKCKYSYNKISQFLGIDNNFVINIARLSLIISDHTYSSQPSSNNYHDKRFKVVANIKEGIINQYLDNHVCEVSNRAYLFAKQIYSLRNNLPSLSKFDSMRKLSKGKFIWQNKAVSETVPLAQESDKIGFFAVNLASTGTGKTFTNAKIMCAISGFKNARLTYTLGLRSLTIQTGNALKEKLLLKDKIVIKIGSQAVAQIQQILHTSDDSAERLTGSDILEDYDKDILNYCTDDIQYNYALDVLKQSCASEHFKILSAPVMVSTIDYIIKASQEYRGGRHIISTLRLYTSDLIIDEVDEYNVEDYINIYMLVYYAASYGSRVLVSSATANSIFTKFLFKAYTAGRSVFNKANSIQSEETILGIYSESSINVSKIVFDDFAIKYRDTIDSHINYLQTKKLQKTRGEIIDIDSFLHEVNHEISANSIYARLILKYVNNISQRIFTSKNGVQITTCLVRFANIDPLTETVKDFVSNIISNNICYHLCIYHSRFTVGDRSKIETLLDSIMNRNNDIFSNEYISNLLLNSEYKKHIIIVFSSPVEEVGRDHDYDFAIIEPSSYRSIVQIAGRVNRHREIQAEFSNLFIFQYNFRKLQSILNNKKIDRCFYNPGFETGKFSSQLDSYLKLNSHSLYDILSNEKLANVNSSYIINEFNLQSIKCEQLISRSNLSDLTLLEHSSVYDQLSNFDILFCNSSYKMLCGNFQRYHFFRDNAGINDYSGYIDYDDNRENAIFYYIVETQKKSIRVKLLNESYLFKENLTYLAINFYSDRDIDSTNILNELNFKSYYEPGELNLTYSTIFGLMF